MQHSWVTLDVALTKVAIPIKNLLPFGIFPKGGGVMSESKRFEELFCSVHVWTFFQKGGGLPYSKLFEELLCLSLEIFQESGGFLVPKKIWNFSA